MVIDWLLGKQFNNFIWNLDVLYRIQPRLFRTINIVW
jgi:hypothetical protein